LVDAADFRRLARISQLGLVSLVYPAAIHTRLEHSLGVYRLALLYLKRLSHDPRFAASVPPAQAERFIAAALLHDLGHWPFCHPIEDLALPGVPTHEQQAEEFLRSGELADALESDWGIDPADVARLLANPPGDIPSRILHSMLSGPIDIDKMDYLHRDSLHAGVPYGRHFDQQRLIGSLCLNEAGDALAITDKGKTAAEMAVFARYVMFCEVYWHHAVRAATAMLQRAFYRLVGKLDLAALFRQHEAPMIAELVSAAEREDPEARELLDGLFGPRRRLYKRLAQYSFFEQRDVYVRLARRPYAWLAACAERLAAGLSRAWGEPVAPHEVLIDAPPMHREIEFCIDVYYPKQRRYRPLSDVSPVVAALAQRQFDDFVKRVRIFVHPRLAARARAFAELSGLLDEAISA
jgi:HD superfamily phosphohydrolase